MKKMLKALGKAFCYFALFFGVQFLVTAIFSGVLTFNIMSEVGFDVSEDQFVDLVSKVTSEISARATLITLISDAVSVFFVWLFFKLRKKSLLECTEVRKCSMQMFIASLVFGVSFLNVVPGLIQLIPFSDKLVNDFNAGQAVLNTGNPVIGFIAVVIIGPVAEELFFRGLIYTRIKKGTNMVIAAVISSLLFGLLHGEVIWIIITFVMGIMFVAMFEKTKSLVPCIVIHMANNSLAQLTSDGFEIADWAAGIIFAVCVIGIIASGIYLFTHKAENAPVQIDTEEI